MKRGDIFHDGLLGLWVIHEKPKGKKLFVVPLDKLYEKTKKGKCSFFHSLSNWDFTKAKFICNLYDYPEKAKKLCSTPHNTPS